MALDVHHQSKLTAYRTRQAMRQSLADINIKHKERLLVEAKKVEERNKVTIQDRMLQLRKKSERMKQLRRVSGVPRVLSYFNKVSVSKMQ
jgi:hypothetical protein